MSKTPVSILQELMVKKNMIPLYELFHEGGEPHIFTYQVSCDGLVERGSGRCKKEAKHEAAKAMLQKISIQTVFPESTILEQNPVKRSLPTEEVIVAPKKARNTSLTSAVAVLNQLCVDNRMQKPEYEIQYSGPPHDFIFTATCIVSEFKEEGVAKTKKEAKRIAASKILEKIQVKGINKTKVQNTAEIGRKISESSQLSNNHSVETKVQAASKTGKEILESDQVAVKNLRNSDVDSHDKKVNSKECSAKQTTVSQKLASTEVPKKKV